VLLGGTGDEGGTLTEKSPELVLFVIVRGPTPSCPVGDVFVIWK
jgi:hypothetical protein